MEARAGSVDILISIFVFACFTFCPSLGIWYLFLPLSSPLSMSLHLSLCFLSRSQGTKTEALF